jgi:hypothetical protein
MLHEVPGPVIPSAGAPGPGPVPEPPAWRDDLAAAVGTALFPGDDGFESLATPWNLAVTSRAAAVVAAGDAEDVARTIRFASANRIPVAVQCTGHGAHADLSGAILVATRSLDEVEIHPDGRWARAGAGVVWQRVIEAAGEHGLAPLAGSSPGVGVVGYTTGGGIGPLARTLGIASDRVRALDLVTGDGRRVRVSPAEEPDLFWGVRGGKGSLGIVTAIEFDLLPIRELYAGAVYFDGASAADVLRTWSEWCPTLPPEATTSLAILQLPEMPGVPEPLAGRLTVAVRFAWTGDPEAGARVLEPIRAVATPLLDGVGVMPYTALGTIHSDPVDPLPGYESGRLLSGLPTAAVERLLAVAGPGSGSPQIMVEVRQLGGAIAAGGTHPSAFCHRDAAFSLLAIGIGAPPVVEAVVDHAARLIAAMAPWSMDAEVPNFGVGTGAERMRRVYTPEVAARLRVLSASSDPAGILIAARGLFG